MLVALRSKTNFLNEFLVDVIIFSQKLIFKLILLAFYSGADVDPTHTVTVKVVE